MILKMDLFLECDNCGKQDSVEICPSYPDYADIEHCLSRHGWAMDGQEAYCPQCSGETNLAD